MQCLDRARQDQRKQQCEGDRRERRVGLVEQEAEGTENQHFACRHRSARATSARDWGVLEVTVSIS